MKNRIFLIPVLVLTVICLCSRSEFGGLGVEVPAGEKKVTKDTPFTIVSVFKGGTGEAAGLKPGDVIISVNRVPLEGLTYNHIVVNLLRGKVDTTVNLEIMRNGEMLNFKVRRGKIVLR